MKRRSAQAAAKPVLERYQIPRFAFIWLLVAVVSVILPHLGRMPLWLSVACALCIGCRILIYQGRMSLPGTKVKLALVAAMLVLVPLQYGRDIFSTDATVGVLLVGITLKLLEMHRKRDILLVLYLCYFTVIAEFIYSQSIPIAVYMGCAVVLITAALMALHQTQQAQAPLRTLKLSGLILLQSIPLMVAFFLLFPRISPLWSVPLQTNAGTTGLSNTMAPGDIGELTRSGELAFRVLFSGEPPPYQELYWRALTLDRFDGREWTRLFNPEVQQLPPTPDNMRAWYRDIEYLGAPIEYNVIMEPTFQSWVYTLQMPQMFDERMRMRSDYQVETGRRISQRFSYDARAMTEYRVEASGDGGLQRRFVELPRDSNPRARSFAADLRAANPVDADYVDAVLNHFRSESFFYTLSPAQLGEHPVDDFLFTTREGFCEHYSSAFTYLMRAGGVPARVVTGYQGGEFNPYDSTLTVRQYDAHAWSEVWLPERGWIRVDPTAAVAPERISQGSDRVLQQEESFMDNEGFTLMRFRNSLLLNDLRLRLEMLDYAWNRFVLNYDQDMQFRFFNQLFGTVTRTKIIVTVVTFMLLATLFVAVTVFRRSPLAPRPPATVQYLRFCSYMARLGHPRHAGETPLHYMERMRQAFPQWSGELTDITEAFVELAFKGPDQDPDKLRELQRRVRNFRVLN